MGNIVLWASIGVLASVDIVRTISPNAPLGNSREVQHIEASLKRRIALIFPHQPNTQAADGQSQETAVLGASASVPLAQSEREQKEERLAYWKTVISKHPDYAAAYIPLITISYELGETADIPQYLATLKQLDPNEEYIPKLEALSSK